MVKKAKKNPEKSLLFFAFTLSFLSIFLWVCGQYDETILSEPGEKQKKFDLAKSYDKRSLVISPFYCISFNQYEESQIFYKKSKDDIVEKKALCEGFHATVDHIEGKEPDQWTDGVLRAGDLDRFAFERRLKIICTSSRGHSISYSFDTFNSEIKDTNKFKIKNLRVYGLADLDIEANKIFEFVSYPQSEFSCEKDSW